MKKCAICGGTGTDHQRYWFMRTRWFHGMRGLSLAVSIWKKPWYPETDEPFDNISWSTAWQVGKDIWLKR